jgi:hypothetical protein
VLAMLNCQVTGAPVIRQYAAEGRGIWNGYLGECMHVHAIAGVSATTTSAAHPRGDANGGQPRPAHVQLGRSCAA